MNKETKIPQRDFDFICFCIGIVLMILSIIIPINTHAQLAYTSHNIEVTQVDERVKTAYVLFENQNTSSYVISNKFNSTNNKYNRELKEFLWNYLKPCENSHIYLELNYGALIDVPITYEEFNGEMMYIWSEDEVYYTIDQIRNEIYDRFKI